MTWNYRVIEDNGQFSIHEVYYNDAGEITSVTENPIAPGGETLEGLQEDIGNHSGRWRGPECELQINIKEGVFSAEGRYERQRLGLSLYDAFLESPGFGSPPKTSKYRITYVGTVYGSTAKCTVTRKEESKSDASHSALGGTTNEKEVLMILSGTLREIRVYEKGSTNDRMFYTLARID